MPQRHRLAALALMVTLAGCTPGPTEPRLAPHAATVNPSCAPSAGPAPLAAATIIPPAVTADKPVDFAGVHNVVTYGAGFYSGSVPEGEEGFKTLRAMGIRTVISVDGAAPDVVTAQAQGLRYVHLPIGYHGMNRQRTLELARATRDLPGPVYIHCHHGKHRSAGAAGAVAVTLGMSTREQALQRMQVSGTAANYTGLFACVKDSTPATGEELAATSNAFPSTYRTSGMVQGMVEIDETFDHLKLVETAGWKAPADHPDLVPAALAGALADHFRVLTETDKVKAKPAEFLQRLVNSSHQATGLEDSIVAGKPAADLSKQFKAIAASCKDCHAKYRD